MMKFKPNQTRTYDGEGFKKRAACLCFKNEREEEVGDPAVAADWVQCRLTARIKQLNGLLIW